MRTHECDLVPESECGGISACLPLQQDSYCLPPVVTDACGPGDATNCDVLVAATNACGRDSLFCLAAVTGFVCPPELTQCPPPSPVIIAARPAALCFRSDEPKLNPNSLAELGVMRRQLTAYLKAIYVRERALAHALTPKNPRQLRAAEAVLNRALQDLKARRQFLQARAAKKAAPAKKSVPAKKRSAKKAASKKASRKK